MKGPCLLKKGLVVRRLIKNGGRVAVHKIRLARLTRERTEIVS